MVKKTILTSLTILLSAIFLTGCTDTNSFYYVVERGDCLSNRFSNINRDLDITFDWKYESLWLEWQTYENDDFDGYYIMRDESETCPYYYSGSDYYKYIYYSDMSYYKDEDTEPGKTYYYRVCMKQKDKDVECGNVKKLVRKADSPQ